MTTRGRIEVSSDVMMGKPVIRGTRIPVELILRRLSEGAAIEELLQSYPHLRAEDVRAASEDARRLFGDLFAGA